MNSRLELALLLSLLAGTATVLGALSTLLIRKPGPRFMSLILGFSAGVMILVSFAELLQQGIREAGFLKGYLGFFGGMIVMFLLDALIPHGHMGEYHDAGIKRPPDTCGCGPEAGRNGRQKGSGLFQRVNRSRLFKTGFLVAMGIGIHNLPEGMATFVGTMQNFKLGLIIAIAIALHNIPEGIAMTAPMWVATGSRKKALFWASVSGAAEPLGALLAALILLPFLSPVLLGVLLAGVAGIMIYIALDELIPVGCSFQHENLSILGVMAGMAVMALSLVLLR